LISLFLIIQSIVLSSTLNSLNPDEEVFYYFFNLKENCSPSYCLDFGEQIFFIDNIQKLHVISVNDNFISSYNTFTSFYFKKIVKINNLILGIKINKVKPPELVFIDIHEPRKIAKILLFEIKDFVLIGTSLYYITNNAIISYTFSDYDLDNYISLNLPTNSIFKINSSVENNNLFLELEFDSDESIFIKVKDHLKTYKKIKHLK